MKKMESLNFKKGIFILIGVSTEFLLKSLAFGLFKRLISHNLHFPVSGFSFQYLHLVIDLLYKFDSVGEERLDVVALFFLTFDPHSSSSGAHGWF